MAERARANSEVAPPENFESVTSKDRARGRVLEALVAGGALQSAIAIAWVIAKPPAALIGVTYFVWFCAVGFIAQRGFQSLARFIWSLIGCFWGAIAFWVTSIPITLRSDQLTSAMAYPLPLMRQGFDTAFDLVPVLTTALLAGVVAGTIGWAIWASTVESEFGQIDSLSRVVPATDHAPSLRETAPGGEPIGESEEGDQLAPGSREIWGPPTPS